MIDIRAYFDDIGIDWIDRGKNVSKGAVEINCPFCGLDPSKHLGVWGDYKYGGFHCWVCGEKGSLLKLVMKIEGVGFEKAKKILDSFRKGDFVDDEIEKEKVVNFFFGDYF